MPTIEQKTATIYRFPLERRLSGSSRSEAHSFPQAEVTNSEAVVAAATSWYHAEAIEADREVRLGAPRH